jgi:hypothetical protein
MAAKPAKPAIRIIPGRELELGGLTLAMVGEKRNYNLQPEVTEYQLWPFSTIAWEAAQNRYRARAIIRHKTTHDMVVFNSWHQDFADAERAIALVSDSLNGLGPRRVYNIFGETIEVHSADIGGGSPVNVTEVLALIWSMQQIE